MKATSATLAKALQRVIETAADLDARTVELEDQEQAYTAAWLRLHRDGLIKGRNEGARRASELEQLQEERADRAGARLAHRRAELWHQVAVMQFEAVLATVRAGETARKRKR